MGQVIYNSAADLVSSGIIRVAKLPPENWDDLEAVPFYTIPLLAEDYPAKTAVMWNTAYREFGMPERNSMVIASPDDASVILETFRRDPRYRGGGAGVGFKERVIPYLDEITPLAGAMCAVNILKAVNDRLLGDNTDGIGYAIALEEKFRTRQESLPGKKVMIIGAGGSGRAIAFALAEKGVLLAIVNRTVKKAQTLADQLNEYFRRPAATSHSLERIPNLLPFMDAVVSVIDSPVTPLDQYSPLAGMLLPVDSERIAENLKKSAKLLQHAKSSLIVSDIRIRKEEIAFLRQARSLGFETLDGIPMVTNQGIEAFWWLYRDKLLTEGRTKKDVAAIMREAATKQ